MRKYLPNSIKSAIRFIYYKNEKKKVFREPYIKKAQNKLLQKNFDFNADKLIVFLVDGADWFTGKDLISGGILSIASIYEETEKLKNLHGATMIMVTQPNAHLLLKHTQFPNEINLYRFEQLQKFSKVKSILFHIPEFLFQNELINNIQNIFLYLSPQSIHLNILNQRIDIMPEPQTIEQVKAKGYDLTQTTAHEQYSTQEIRAKFGIPLHKLSVYATPERYSYIPYQNKENLILVSPDEAEEKSDIIIRIQEELPDYDIIIIQGITYLKYLDLVKRAKYMITFGEGLDFYFVETVFSGGISFAIYNEEFFTKDFKSAPGIYKSYEHMSQAIIDNIKALENNNVNYMEVNKVQFDTCHKIYNEKYYKENLVDFYNKNYLFP